MHPVILDLGPLKLHSYGLMIFLAFVAGTWLGVRRASKIDIPTGVVMDMTVWVLISSLLGARLTYVIVHMDEFRGRWLDTISPVQSDGTIGIAGLIILGGLAAGIPVAWLFLRRRGIPFLKMADVMIPSLALGVAVGRVGCFLNGCCFGKPTDLPWGVVFPYGCYAASVFPDQSIHPTQLYSVLYNAVICIVLLLRSPHRKFQGELFYMYLLLYGIARACVESVRYIRFDTVPQIGGLQISGSMAAATLMAVAGLVLLIRGHHRARDDAAR